MKNKMITLMILSLFLVSCNKGGGGGSSDKSSDNSEAPVVGDSSGETTGGTTGETTGTTTGGTTGATTGATTGGTTGSTTGGTTGGTTGSTTGGTSGGSNGTGLPNEAYTFETNITFVNVDSNDREKFEKAIEIIKKVVATEEFRSQVLNHTYSGSKTYVDNGGYSNSQIYQKILDAAETLQNTKDNEMDLEVELYYAATSTVGYTYANSKRIWVNTKYFDTNSVTSVAANLFHEWLHKLGFKHAVSYSTSRDYSVPYAIGRMVGSIGKNFD